VTSIARKFTRAKPPPRPASYSSLPSAFEPQREAQRQSIPQPRPRPIVLEGGAVAGVEREKASRRQIEPAFRLQQQPQRTALHRIVRIVRHDLLVLALDAGEQLDDQTSRDELVTDRGQEIPVFKALSECWLEFTRAIFLQR